MTAPKITSLLQDYAGLICTSTNDDGELSVVLAHDHRVVSQLFKNTLTTQIGSIPYAPDLGIDWLGYRSGEDIAFLPVEINALGSAVYGVRSVDLSQAEYDDQTIEIRNVCFTTDCANSINYETVST